MKKIALMLLFVGASFIAVSMYFKTHSNYTNLKQENAAIKNKIKNIDTKKQIENDLNATLNNDLINLKAKLNKEIKKYEVWVKTKEKLNSVIS